MNTLADLLNLIVSTLQTSPLCAGVRVLETLQFSDTQFAFKVRADLKSGDVLQVRLYLNGEHTDYAFQLLRDDKPVVRWDNKEHFPSISSRPHHFHNASGQIESSPLTGDATHDLPLVLKYLESR
ncbi:MAG: hypothetical protein KGJ80_22455 [Chloroflexota bacterium]|nr:hypothetical protein [Chloroflexota bacterium]